MKKAIVYYNYNNKEVLHDYLTIVSKSLESLGYTPEFSVKLQEKDKNALIVGFLALGFVLLCF